MTNDRQQTQQDVQVSTPGTAPNPTMSNHNASAARGVFDRFEPRVEGADVSPLVSHDLHPAPRSPISPARGAGVALQVEPRWDLLLPGEPCACDIEFQNYHHSGDTHPPGHKKAGRKRWRSRLGWISIVNTRGEIVLDVHVRYPRANSVEVQLPRAPDKDFGVTFARLRVENGAAEARAVERWCSTLFASRTVIFHDASNDRKAFTIEDVFAAVEAVHDTQVDWAHTAEADFSARPGLARLAFNVLGENVQAGGVHGPFEDAWTAMKLYLERHSFDREAEAAKWQAVYRD